MIYHTICSCENCIGIQEKIKKYKSEIEELKAGSQCLQNQCMELEARLAGSHKHTLKYDSVNRSYWCDDCGECFLKKNS